MQTTTNDYNQAIYNGHRECVVRLDIGSESFSAADIQSLSIKYDANSESSFALGSVCSACLEFTTGIGSALNTKAAGWWTSNAISVSMGIKTGENAGTPVYEYIPCGVFYVSERAKNDAKTYKITAMDAIWKLSGEITSESFSFPCTLGNVFETLCTAFGVTASQASFPNKSTTIAEGSLFSTTGTTVLGWIAQAAGCFARATRSGNVELSWYSDPDHELGDDDIYSIEVGEFISPAITKLTIRKEEGDLGVSTGTDGYTYYITDNPLLYETETAQNCLAGIFGHIQGFQSQTVSMDVRGNPAVEIGDILTITATNVGNLIQKDSKSKAYVMHHSLTFNGGIHGQYSSDGEDPEEEAESEIATYIHVLENKANVLTRTLDETISHLSDYATHGDVTEAKESILEQTAENITSVVSSVNGNKAEAEEGLEAAREELIKLRKTVDDNKDEADKAFAGIDQWQDQISFAVGNLEDATKYVTLDNDNFLVVGMNNSDFNVHVTNTLVEIRNLQTSLAIFSTDGLIAPTITAQETITLSPIQIKANGDLGWLLVKA